MSIDEERDRALIATFPGPSPNDHRRARPGAESAGRRPDGRARVAARARRNRFATRAFARPVKDDYQSTGTAPDLADPVVGFRQWRLADGRLRSLCSGVQWHGRELGARCALSNPDSHISPANACSCGIYAYYNPCPRTASAGTRAFIAGAVVLWRRIELHAAACARNTRVLSRSSFPCPEAESGSNSTSSRGV